MDDARSPANRVFLSNYECTLEIGAYRAEYGVTQRLRFDVELDVAANPAPLADRVEDVLNYDLIIDAIERIAAGARMDLLETFAERLANVLLENEKSRRVRIRIAKLDRLPGAATLGCEIVRMKP